MHISGKNDLIRLIDRTNVMIGSYTVTQNRTLHGTSMEWDITLTEFTSDSLIRSIGVGQEHNEAYLDIVERGVEKDWDQYVQHSGR